MRFGIVAGLFVLTALGCSGNSSSDDGAEPGGAPAGGGSDAAPDERDATGSVGGTGGAGGADPPSTDADDDSVPNATDNCPSVANADQADGDTDGLGDACDLCPVDADPGQEDQDEDGLGDACDVCPAEAVQGDNHRDADGDGEPTCAGDCDDASPDRRGLAAELCDGVDNDCDERTDEGFDGVGLACAAGEGACRREAVAVCLPDGSVGCPATAGAPGAELCNDLDDDCDGQADEDLAGCCAVGESEACGQDEGECAVGERVCGAGGVWGACDGAGPADEVCNGLDEDCDGLTDEALGVVPCGVGLCARDQPACLGGAAPVCEPLLGAMPEQCNGLDDDCDGVVDPPPCDAPRPADLAALLPAYNLLLLH